MVCRNAVSFQSKQMPGTRYAYFLAQVMPKFTENFGMTFAKKKDIWGIATNAWAGYLST